MEPAHASLGIALCLALLGLAACSNPAAQAKREGGYPVAIRFSASHAARAISGDPLVTSVQVFAYNADTGAKIGSDTLTYDSGTNTWYNHGMNVEQTGWIIFQVYARASGGGLRYVGESTINVKGTGSDYVVIPAQAIRIMGGSVQKIGASMNPTPKYYFTGGSIEASGAVGCTTDGLNLYIGDYYSNTIQKIVISSGLSAVFAGSGSAGHADGFGTAASFSYPYSVTTDGSYLYISDLNNNEIRRVDIASAEVSTIVGSWESTGTHDDYGTAAELSAPGHITNDGQGHLFCYSYGSTSSTLSKIDLANGAEVKSLAEGGGWVSNPAQPATLPSYYSMTCDGTNLYIALGDSSIGQIATATGAFSTFLTDATNLTNTFSVATDGTTLYIDDFIKGEIFKSPLLSPAVSAMATYVNSPRLDTYLTTNGEFLFASQEHD